MEFNWYFFYMNGIYSNIMWLKECHFYHPWLGMVNIAPIKNGHFGGGSHDIVLTTKSCGFVRNPPPNRWLKSIQPIHTGMFTIYRNWWIDSGNPTRKQGKFPGSEGIFDQGKIWRPKKMCWPGFFFRFDQRRARRIMDLDIYIYTLDVGWSGSPAVSQKMSGLVPHLGPLQLQHLAGECCRESPKSVCLVHPFLEKYLNLVQ